MSFKLIIEVRDSKLMPTLKLLNGHKVYIESVADTPKPVKPTKKGNPHTRATSRLTMTGKKAQSGSIIEQGMVLFEKLEKRKGIGTATVMDFRETLVNNKHPAAVSQRCITEGFLSYLDG
jgi:hypothetical protein